MSHSYNLVDNIYSVFTKSTFATINVHVSYFSCTSKVLSGATFMINSTFTFSRIETHNVVAIFHRPTLEDPRISFSRAYCLGCTPSHRRTRLTINHIGDIAHSSDRGVRVIFRHYYPLYKSLASLMLWICCQTRLRRFREKFYFQIMLEYHFSALTSLRF